MNLKDAQAELAKNPAVLSTALRDVRTSFADIKNGYQNPAALNAEDAQFWQSIAGKPAAAAGARI